MKKFFIALAGILMFSGTYAQVNDVNNELKKTEMAQKEDSIPDGWYKAGAFSLLFNQSAFSNWLAGGTNNVGGNVGLNYDFNYRKGDLMWDNRIILGYGLNKLAGDDLKKTNDQIEFNSILGKKANFGKYWSWSFFLNFRSQFTDGYNYGAPDYKGHWTSGFLKPGYLTFGPGLLYKKSENFKINIAPLTSKLTFLNGHVYRWNADAGVYENSQTTKMFGVEPGDNLLYQLGMYASLYYKTNIMENISMENILNLYSNYLNKPQNIDIDYTMNLVMQINKYIATNLTFQTIYDDDAYAGFQVREVFGLGMNYNF